MPRGFRVTKDLQDKFDYSKGCPKCEALRRGDNRQTVHHSKECRKRIEERMRQDPALKQKLSEVEERQNRWIGRRIEAHDAPASPTPVMEQALEASAPVAELEQLSVGSPTGPSGQGGEVDKIVQNFQIKITKLENTSTSSSSRLRKLWRRRTRSPRKKGKGDLTYAQLERIRQWASMTLRSCSAP